MSERRYTPESFTEMANRQESAAYGWRRAGDNESANEAETVAAMLRQAAEDAEALDFLVKPERDR